MRTKKQTDSFLELFLVFWLFFARFRAYIWRKLVNCATILCMGTSLLSQEQFLEHLCSSFELNRDQAQRMTEEFLSFWSQDLESWVANRHLQLQTDGWRNSEIYSQIKTELSKRRFSEENLSERQIRRLIYG